MLVEVLFFYVFSFLLVSLRDLIFLNRRDFIIFEYIVYVFFVVSIYILKWIVYMFR